MRFVTIFYVLIILIGCSDDYPNPKTVIEISRPFVLKNTEQMMIPKGNVDIAVFPNEENPEYVISLKNIVDNRCSSCLKPQNSFYVELDINGKAVYLGKIVGNEIVNPKITEPLSLVENLGTKRISLVTIEKASENELINQMARYKEVTLILTNL